ncbi:class I SAM-dependent methyltransferase [Thermosynechococcaceae cyanobacterium BACA0444]|uniref:Class I SAM-dependent methyltransferase n=1 Tax=Pseudocalidococcus azoricus BACA0444 TaxID=2918990 RepID=A0AAE4FT95_9CYAN|nr:class I SAM-dependent methyltransferase [Pseudocalidococcus azoricus]MDS3860571.1 class I SAM-dependent methyltransferase [Pseudocalidococcus azoricus BACA0444]
MLSKAETITKVTTMFNSAADYFDAPALSFWHCYGQKTIDYLAPRPGDRVLHVCCGSGASAISVPRAVGASGRVLGVDLAEALLELARQKAEYQGLANIEFRAGDFENLGLPDTSFDRVICVFGIFFVPDMAAVQSRSDMQLLKNLNSQTGLNRDD